jgi:hypothetical protein
VRILLLLVALAGVVEGAPRYKRPASTAPALADAEKLWLAAAAENDPRARPEAWEKAASAFIAIVDAGKLTPSEERDAAYAALLAMKNALSVDPRASTAPVEDKQIDWRKAPTPKPIPEREAKMIHVFTVYLKIDASSPDAVGVKFLHANILRRYDHLDAAIAIFLDILDRHRTHEVAEFSANLVLDSYNRLQKYTELVALAERLRADKGFLADKPDLAELVRRIRIQSLRIRGDNLGKSPDREERARCGEAYLEVVDELDGRDRDEVLFNALVCFGEAGALDRFRAVAARLDVPATDPRLRIRGLARLGHVEATVGNFAAAAAALERYVAAAPREKDAFDAAADAFTYRLGLGELKRALHDLASLERVARRNTQSTLPLYKLRAVAELLAVGKRHDAMTLARAVEMKGDWTARGVSPADAAVILADAACPIALIDGLCPRLRDGDVQQRVVAELRRMAGTDLQDVGVLLSVDFRLESLLARRSGEQIDRITLEYRKLTSSTRDDVRAVAHGRLARLAQHRKQDPAGELEACVREARAGGVDRWIRICERERATLKLPPIEPIRERLPALTSDLPTATEMLR